MEVNELIVQYVGIVSGGSGYGGKQRGGGGRQNQRHQPY